MPIINVLDHGAQGDGATNDAPAIQAAIDACVAQGGGRVVLPAGRVFLSGTIFLKSRVELRLEHASVLRASLNPEDYAPGMRPRLLAADDAEDVAITGSGVIDGQGEKVMAAEEPYIFIKPKWRPYVLLFSGCKRVTMRDVTVRDGAAWTLWFRGCRDLGMHDMRIYNSLKIPNSDAIDLDCCKHVRITGCHIEAGDDCVCLKTVKETAEIYGACEDVVVSNCTLISTSGALIIGCEAHAPMRNVIFDSCTIASSHRGLAVHLSQPADVENIIFSNMTVETRYFYPKWWGRAEPIYVVSIPWRSDHTVGQIRNVRFQNIYCRSENGVFVQGWTPDRVDGVVFENVRVELDKWSKWNTGQHDIRPYPEDHGGPGPVGCGVYDHPTAGFYIKNARNITLRGCEVAWAKNPPAHFAHAIEAHGAEGLRVENFRGTAAHPEIADRLID